METIRSILYSAGIAHDDVAGITRWARVMHRNSIKWGSSTPFWQCVAVKCRRDARDLITYAREIRNMKLKAE